MQETLDTIVDEHQSDAIGNRIYWDLSTWSQVSKCNVVVLTIY